MRPVIILVLGIMLWIIVHCVEVYLIEKENSRDKLGRKIETQRTLLSGLTDTHRERVERSMLMLENHPDLRNPLGVLVSDRYANQIATILERHRKAAPIVMPARDSDMPARDSDKHEGDRPDATDVLLENGLAIIERKIEKALAIKGESAREDLDVYVRFLEEAD
jgi:hypothetical protein